MTDHSSLKAIKIIVIILLLLMLTGAIIFYKERMLFLDGSFMLFNIINSGSLQVQEHRIGSFITQILPWIGVKLHLPLNILMLIYSCSFTLFFLGVGLLLLYRYRRYDLALLLAFYLTLFVSDTYFWTNNEVHQGITWLLLAFAATNKAMKDNRFAIGTTALFFVLFSIAIWTHPLVLIVAPFLWGFYWIQKENWPYTAKQSVFYTILLLLILISKFYLSSSHGYDSGKIEAFEQFNFRHSFEIFAYPQAQFILRNCVTHYWLFTLLFIAGMTCLLQAKKYLLFVWTIIFIGGYFLLLCITYKDASGLRFYMESEYMPATIIGTAPFIYYLLPRLSAKRITILLTLIFIIRIAYILNAAPFFIKRVAVTEQIVRKMHEKGYTKIIIPDMDKDVDDKLIMNWGAPVETMFLSALKGENPQRTAVFMDSARMKNALNVKPNVLQSCFTTAGDSVFNREYFNIDTTSNYIILGYKQLLK